MHATQMIALHGADLALTEHLASIEGEEEPAPEVFNRGGRSTVTGY